MLTIFLILIFIRPFICSLAYTYLDPIYSALLLVFLLIWLIRRRIPFHKIQLIKFPLILFILALSISIIFSLDKISSLRESYQYLTAILFFLLTASFQDKEREYVLLSVLSAGSLISLLALRQYFLGFQRLTNYNAEHKIFSAFVLDIISRRRVFFPFVTPNILGGYLAMLIPLSLISKRSALLITVLSIALLLTKSLGALLSIFLALVVYFYLQGKLKKKELFFLFGVLLVMALVFISRAKMQGKHTQPIFSTVMRINYWMDTLKLIKAHPLTGVGLGNFNLPQSRYAHNSYLQIWAEMGILGIVSFLWLIIAILRSAFRSIKDSPHKNQIAALITANAVFLLHNLVDFSFFLPEVNLIWWLVLGLLLAT